MLLTHLLVRFSFILITTNSFLVCESTRHHNGSHSVRHAMKQRLSILQSIALSNHGGGTNQCNTTSFVIITENQFGEHLHYFINATVFRFAFLTSV